MQLSIIKIGGNIIDDESKLSAFLDALRLCREEGAGTRRREAGDEGSRRAWDPAAVGRWPPDHRCGNAAGGDDGVCGDDHKGIVAQLQARGCAAIGLTGADGNAILSHKRVHASIDYGFVGDVDQVNTPLLTGLLLQDKTIVFAPITHDGKGQC